jgi:hypothetical protein
LNWVNAYLLAFSTLSFKRHNAVYESKQGIVFAQTNIVAGMKRTAALTHQNIACSHNLTAEAFDA